MAEEKIDEALRLLLKQAKMPEDTKEGVRKQVFADAVLSDDDLSFVAAAGEPSQPENE